MFPKIVRLNCFNDFKMLKRSLRNRPDFTKNRYKIPRGNYNYLHDDHIKYFRNLLGDERLIMDLSDLERYNVDWYKQVRGCSTVVLKPKTTDEISKILSFCNKENLAICTQGGNTGVVGGCVPVFDEIVISTELLNEIISFDENSGILTSQSGCILQNLDNFLAEKNFMVPLDLGAKGTCQIGGNVSTNAGGMRLLRYGNMHGNVLGLEAVLANGEIIDCLSTLKKDNTGYHLKHLFIGSEGTLGVITKVSIQCPTRPKFRNVALLGLQNYDKVLKTYRLVKHSLAEILSAIEVMDAGFMEFVKDKNNKKLPIDDYPFYLMLETTGSNESHDQEKLNKLFEEVIQKGLVLNGTVASDAKKVEEIWSIRDTISDGIKECKAVLLYDISLPLVHYYRIIEDIREYLGNKCLTVFGYGHIGDGNLHITIQLDNYDNQLKEDVENYVLERTLAYEGSVSAEHGLGFMKAHYLDKIKAKNTLNLMKNIKEMMDPKGILNPYKVIQKQH
ncbi:unnamed protein product [Phyllotreta striolata]|uniref:D-2-hydroxyglutarate dehydrogenase, mitochondrial n=1 Tax=Phyllotreta striolata TaxID=444603 RepID=A0A9N9TJZ7_PHYSR|nr:unnamed protein product [Phyllotreta striolata]